MKKKWISAMLSLSLVASLAACGGKGEPTPTPTTGGPTVIQGEAQGRNGILKVDVTLNGETIEAVTVTEHTETAGVADPAINDLPSAIVAAQSIAVDGVAGATITSDAIKAAVKDALTKTGLDTAKYEAATDKTLTQKDAETADVVIVGAGLAGVMAANEFKSNYPQLNVVLLEQLGQIGGSLPATGGAILATDSTRHQELDMVCTPSDIADYLKESSMTDDLNTDLIENVYALSGESFDLLVNAGLPLQDGLSASSPHNEKIFAAWAEGRGAGFHQFLTGYVENAGFDLRLNSRVTGLVVENGTVTGVAVEDKEYAYQINTKAVLLCTGGFASNAELMAQYAPVWSKGQITVNAGANGDAITFTRQFGTPVTGNGTMGTLALYEGQGGVQTTFMVGPDGRRFVNEQIAGYRVQRATADIGGIAYRIATATDATRETLETNVTTGGTKKFDTLEELADAMGIDKEGLLAEVSEYTAQAQAGGEVKFGLPAEAAMDLSQGPYYVAKVTTGTFGTLSGIVVKDNCQVSDGDGNSIPGLFAAGETIVNNAYTYQYPGAGFGISFAVNSGRYAAQQVANSLK